MTTVVAQAPSRLHFGLVNESGDFGRIDGGLGVSISEPCWKITVKPGRQRITGVAIAPEQRATINEVLRKTSQSLGSGPFAVDVRSTIPCHAGLGSKTALVLTIASAVCSCLGKQTSPFELASLLRRGGTSGVGIAGFWKGGFVYDAGHMFPDTKRHFGPSSLSLAEPARPVFVTSLDWLKVVHFRYATMGLSGRDEARAFINHCPLSTSQTLATMHYTFGYVIPAVWRHDNDMLQDGIRGLQKVGFKQIEWQCQSVTTRRFYKYWQSLALPEAIGLSSFGPTMFILTDRADYICKKILAFPVSAHHLTVTSVASLGAHLVRRA